MEKYEIVTIAIVSIILMTGLGFFVGRQIEINAKSNEVSHLKNEVESKQNELNIKSSISETAGKNYAQLMTDYDKLVADYNKLREEAMRYVNTQNYQARQPVTCSSYDFGTSVTTTNCY